MALESGIRLGSYEISDPLGKGGMGEVYRASDTKLGRDVAIKVLPEEFARDSERLARLEREARLLASLNHPNIAAIHGLEESDGTRFLVLELVEGDTLADRLTGGALTVEESLRLALQIAEAVEAAHEKGVIHRDLKPANIKVTPEGKVKVLDFGLAKVSTEEGGDAGISNSPTLSLASTRQGVILGTAAYMSPEQARGHAADGRTDVWAFGCILYEMLSGTQTWGRETLTDVIGGIVAQEPDWTALPVNLHARVRFLLERCLEKKPKERCQTIAEARAEIAKVLADPAGVFRVVEAPAPSRAILVWTAAAAVAAGLLAGGAAWYLKPADPRPVGRFSQPWPTDQAPRNPGRPVIALSGDGTSFVYNTAAGFYLRELDELVPRLIPETQAPLTNPFFSPDGQWIGFYSPPDGELQRISVNGGAPIPITSATNPFGASWGTDDTIVFAQPDGILRVSASGGEAELIVTTEAGEQAYGPQVLPGGEWVLFTVVSTSATSWDEADIVAESLDTGERRVLIRGGTDGRYVSTGHLVYAFGNSLWAVPFDVGSVRATAGGVRLADGLAMAGATGSANYGVSDDGTLVQIYLADGAGAVRQTNLVYADSSGNIERIGLPSGSYLHARVSPDGTRLAFETRSDAGSEIWIHELAGGTEPLQLTQGGNNSRPIWTPDGEYVTFMSTRGGTPGIWWQKADGSQDAVRLTESDGPAHWPDAWSPDGATLAFTRYGGTEEQSIWMLTLGEGGDPVEYVEGLAGGAVFSPDGDWIAYRAARNPADALDVQIFLKPFPRTGPERQITQNGGTHPLFSADGTEIFYRRAALQAGGPVQNELVSKVVSTASGVNSGAERVLPIQGIPAVLGVRDYDVMPPGDDRLVLMLPSDVGAGTEAAPVAEFRIVLNWTQELLERVPVD